MLDKQTKTGTKIINFREIKEKWKNQGEIPEWYSTNSLQFFLNKYSFENESVRERDMTIANVLAEHTPKKLPEWWNEDPYTKGLTPAQVYFNMLFRDGYAIASTPLKSNAGLPDRGFTVSCSGQALKNNIASKYMNNAELAILTKYSHGTSIDISSWLAEGDPIGEGEVSEGIMPIVDLYTKTTSEVTQGTRRGSIAIYLDIEHGDFWNLAQKAYESPDGLNVGWIVTDEFIEKLKKQDAEALSRLERAIYIRLAKGRGYIVKVDTMNRNKSQVFKNLDLRVLASNLCAEVNLPANEDYTFTCVIINANLALYDEFPKHVFHILHLMQDANVSNYLKQIESLKPHNRELFKKAYNFTKEMRAVGTGAAGLHSLMIQRGYPIGSFDCRRLNIEIFKRMQNDTNEMNVWLADNVGVPDGIKRAGLHLRNATTMMMPPTKSSTELARNTPTEGINLETAMVKVKESAGGEIFRINFEFLKFLKEKGKYNDEVVRSVALNKGSVQHLDWMTPSEKMLFRTAFEIDMNDHLDLVSDRQKYIDQQQSVNLFFTDSDSEEYIGEIHKRALLDEGINSLYYIYSMRGNNGRVKRVSGEECEMCQ